MPQQQHIKFLGEIEGSNISEIDEQVEVHWIRKTGIFRYLRNPAKVLLWTHLKMLWTPGCQRKPKLPDKVPKQKLAQMSLRSNFREMHLTGWSIPDRLKVVNFRPAVMVKFRPALAT